MKRFVFVLLLIPQLIFAQFQSKCFYIEPDGDTMRKTLRLMTDKDAEIPLDYRSPIFGLSVSGSVSFDNDQGSYVRITLKDDYNYEHLVYECYPLLADDLKAEFDNTAFETMVLDGIVPESLKIEIKNAKLNLDSFICLTTKEKGEKDGKRAEDIKSEQCQYIADLMNQNLEKRNMTWRAKVTDVSMKTFEEKKDMFGGLVPELYGFDYYAGGVFVMPQDANYQRMSGRSNTPSQYVTEWDWRNRHGKNWMTSVKNQGNCNSCWIFAAVGALEAYTSLYYNQIASYINHSNEQIIGYNLSEQEIMNCLENNHCANRGTPAKALNYIINNGVVNEECFPYVAYDMSCSDKCINPAERVFLESCDTIPDDASDEYIKTKLFKAPLAFSIVSWGHSMVLAGYKELAAGDVIRTGSGHSIVTISETSHQELIGKTAWLFKNSWDTTWGEENGYAYVVVGTNDRYFTNSLLGKVTCIQHEDGDIVCEDADGDGYYFWGIGNKPSFCPSWVPDIKDGNDADYTKGKLLLENTPVIGELETLNPDGNTTIIISGNTTYTTRQSKFSHIRITSGGKLTVKNILNMFGRVTITVESGGELVIDGGVVTNAYISLASGGKLTIKNGGKIVMRTNSEFYAPAGAFVDVSCGQIIRSNDF